MCALLTAESLLGPFSSGEIPVCDPARIDDVESKHGRLRALIAEQGVDGILLRRSENLAWFTSGGGLVRPGSGETTASILVTPEARVVLTQNCDSARIFDKELHGLGFQLKERPWQEDRNALVQDIARGRKIGSDLPCDRQVDLSSALDSCRRVLGALETERYRVLAREVAHAVEATARTLNVGATESEIAGELAHRLLMRRIQPVRLEIQGDGRGHRYRQWPHGLEAVCRWTSLYAVGERQGLHAAVARTVCFGNADPELARVYPAAAMVAATAIFFSHEGQTLGGVFDRMRRIYEKSGHPDEWREAPQGGLSGYRILEETARPDAALALRPGMALSWHPSVGCARLAESVLVTPEGTEWVTPSEFWPTIEVQVKGVTLAIPGLLCREPTTG